MSATAVLDKMSSSEASSRGDKKLYPTGETGRQRRAAKHRMQRAHRIYNGKMTVLDRLQGNWGWVLIGFGTGSLVLSAGVLAGIWLGLHVQ